MLGRTLFSNYCASCLAILLLAVLGQLDAAPEPIMTTIYRIHPKKCPTLADGPMLAFVDEEPPKLVTFNQTTPFECRRVVECKVMSSPSESNVYWYRNDQLIQATTIRDITFEAMAEKSEQLGPSPPGTMLGLSQMTHRLCVDPFVGTQTEEFKCKLQSLCELNETIESQPILVQPEGHRARRMEAGAGETPNRGTPLLKAPLITMIQSTRMELAGNFVQLMCNAVGNPKPKVNWNVIDDEDETVTHSISKYPFIWELTNGDLLVDSASTDMASISLECRATNPYGSDTATSTLILLSEN
uniref:Ig-like domain-containing protein n=1 Tax=Ditylenchus dipsaci TaxID=166011 RepID=A0A915CNU7_9BILA